GFVVAGRSHVVEAVSVEAVGRTVAADEPELEKTRSTSLMPKASVRMWTLGEAHDTPLFDRAEMQPGDAVDGPAIIVEAAGTNVIEPGWRASCTARGHLILERV